jgi:hypothetical protein
MRINRLVPVEEEPVEFRMLPGQEDDWAGAADMDLSPLWNWLGIYPLYIFFVVMLVLIGIA